MAIFAALSYSRTLPLIRLATAPEWAILSSHRHACNLYAADGTLVALVSEVHGNGPFHIVVPGARFDDFTPATPVKWQNQQIQFSNMTVTLQTAAPWSPQLARCTQSASHNFPNALARLATIRSLLYCGSTALTSCAQRGIQWMRQGVFQQNRALILQGTTLLAGLGPGLTPAGDDFLVGLLAAMWTGCKEGHALWQQSVCAEIAATAATQTTRLSGAWLTCAGRGDFGVQWHALIDALNSHDSRAVHHAGQTILNTGATSGADALCGFLVGALSGID